MNILNRKSEYRGNIKLFLYIILKEVKSNLIFNKIIIIIISRLINIILINNFKKNYNKDFIAKITL